MRMRGSFTHHEQQKMTPLIFAWKSNRGGTRPGLTRPLFTSTGVTVKQIQNEAGPPDGTSVAVSLLSFTARSHAFFSVPENLQP